MSSRSSVVVVAGRVAVARRVAGAGFVAGFVLVLVLVAVALVALGSSSARAGTSSPDAWSFIDKGALIADSVAPSPLKNRVAALHREDLALDDEDISDSLAAVRAYAPALDALDAATATVACTLPRDLPAPRVVALADAALVTALADAADGHPARATADVGRAADLAGLVARCGKPTLLSGALAVSIGERARSVAWFLAEQRLVDDKKLAQMAAALQASAQSSLLERALDGERARVGRAFNLEEQAAVDGVGKKLDAATRDQAALAAACADAAHFEQIARPARAVDVRCNAGADDAHYTVTRAVAHALAHRTGDALAADSVVGPSLDGRGIIVVSAGPIARSCGFRDGDLVVEVNGLSTQRIDQALVQVPAQVGKDGFGAFRVMRFGERVEWRVDVAAVK